VQELPAFEAAYQKFGTQVEFVNINDLSGDPNAPQYVKDKGYDWLFADSKEALQKYNINGIPTTLFIDAQGNLVDQYLGGLEQAQLESKISQIL
jgi:thiol-disulfide isomerase/thioredoxin